MMRLYGTSPNAQVANSSDTDHSNDSSRLDVTSRRGAIDTVVTLAAPGAPFAVSAAGTYVATVRNLGTVATTGTTTVALGGAFDSAAGSGWTCDNNATTCTRSGSISAGGAAPAITVKLVPAGLYGTSPNAQVANSSDTDHSNDSSRLDVTSRRGAIDTVVTLAAPGATLVTGTATTFQATVRNLGTLATAGTLTVTLGGTYGSATGSGWTCDALGTCTRTVAIQGGAASPVITINTTATTSGATVSANVDNSSDTDHSNNTARLELTSALR